MEQINFKPNTKKLKVLTPSGYKSFSGITKILTKKKLLRFETETTAIEVTENHKFYIDDNIVLANDMATGDILDTINGKQIITNISKKDIEEYTYELNDVDGGNIYYTNGIVSHNCKFLGSSNTLIEGDMLERIETQSPSTHKYNGAMLIYEEPQPNEFYILGVDSAKGGGNDYSVIQVIKINGERDVEQVAIYRNNLISPDDFAQVCIGVSDYYNGAYMMVENNDVGQIVADAIWYDYECDRIINCDAKGLGIRSTKKTKLAGNLLIKKYVENGYLQINDSKTLYELSRYEEVSPNVFHAAGQNENDDCVTSLIWALYYLTTPFYDKDDNTISRKDISDKYKIEDDRPIFFDNDIDENWLRGI